MKKRIEFDEVFMSIVNLLEKRSTCLRRQIGAVLVKDNIILSTGYNGAPKGLDHCFKCIRKVNNIKSSTRLEYCRAVHAEQNALIQCLIKQTDCSGSILYCSTSPCVTCAKLLIQAGIKTIVYKKKYPDELAIKMLNDALITLINY